jgi:hypothetical protein
MKSESTNKFGEIPDPPSGCILDRRRRSRRRPAANVSVVSGYRTRPASASKRHKTSCRRPGQAVTLECLSPKRWSGEGAAPHRHRRNRSIGTAICPRSGGVGSRGTTRLRGAVVRTDDGGEAPAGSGRSLGNAPSIAHRRASAHPTQISSANSPALIAMERTHKRKTGCGKAEHVG